MGRTLETNHLFGRIRQARSERLGVLQGVDIAGFETAHNTASRVAIVIVQLLLDLDDSYVLIKPL